MRIHRPNHSAPQLVGPGLELGDFLKPVENNDQSILRIAGGVEQRQRILLGRFSIGGRFKGDFNARGLGVDRHRRPGSE